MHGTAVMKQSAPTLEMLRLGADWTWFSKDFLEERNVTRCHNPSINHYGGGKGS